MYETINSGYMYGCWDFSLILITFISSINQTIVDFDMKVHLAGTLDR